MDEDEFRRYSRVILAAIVVWGLFLLVLMTLAAIWLAQQVGVLK